jgi:hypothetical protein
MSVFDNVRESQPDAQRPPATRPRCRVGQVLARRPPALIADPARTLGTRPDSSARGAGVELAEALANRPCSCSHSPAGASTTRSGGAGSAGARHPRTRARCAGRAPQRLVAVSDKVVADWRKIARGPPALIQRNPEVIKD